MRTVVYHPKVPAKVRDFLDHYDSISRDLGDAFWNEFPFVPPPLPGLKSIGDPSPVADTTG